jgi:hypothetical protein
MLSQFDNTVNELDSISASGYPTLFFFAKGENKKVRTHRLFVDIEYNMGLLAGNLHWGPFLRGHLRIYNGLPNL